MKATLEFSLPEEQDEHRHAIHGLDYFSALWSIREAARRRLKHSDVCSDEVKGALALAYDDICDHTEGLID
ncbi:MAG: hypothetical protein GY841_22425 [FCB group bacterium]|nr:hypothetical protein [FCB group bacterium]